jgi:DNA-binding transcriptional MerR regulator
LYSRRQASELLGGMNVATIRQLEKKGRLKPVRPSGKKTGQVFFTAAELMRAVESMRAGAESE